MIRSGSARLVSLPLESDAIMVRIGKELKKLKAREESSTSAAETISIGLSGVAELYRCICDMLSLPLTNQALSLRRHHSCVGDLIDVSSKLLEVCSATRDTTLQMKEACRGLRSALAGELGSHESSVSSFVCSRKKITKSTKQALSSLERIGGDGFASLGVSGDADQRVAAVIQSLRCISIISISIQENLLVFLGTKPKYTGKRSIFAKLIRRGKSGGEGEELSRSELENVDYAICGISSKRHETRRVACNRLEVLERGIHGIERGLECVFRELTQTRLLLKHTKSGF